MNEAFLLLGQSEFGPRIPCFPVRVRSMSKTQRHSPPGVGWFSDGGAMSEGGTVVTGSGSLHSFTPGVSTISDTNAPQ